MGQKVHPLAFRLSQKFNWASRWFASDQKYKEFLVADVKIRRALMQKLRPAGITRVEIERSVNRIKIMIWVVKPGVLIGRGGKGLEELKNYITGQFKIDPKNLEIVPMEVKNPYLQAQFVGQFVADQISRRMPTRRAITSNLEKMMEAGALGAKIEISGRLGGADIARTQQKKVGKVPLQSLRADIDFARVNAPTKYGIIGVKIWICRGIE